MSHALADSFLPVPTGPGFSLCTFWETRHRGCLKCTGLCLSSRCFSSLLSWVFWTAMLASVAGPSLGQRVFEGLDAGETKRSGTWQARVGLWELQTWSLVLFRLADRAPQFPTPQNVECAQPFLAGARV